LWRYHRNWLGGREYSRTGAGKIGRWFGRRFRRRLRDFGTFRIRATLIFCRSFLNWEGWVIRKCTGSRELKDRTFWFCREPRQKKCVRGFDFEPRWRDTLCCCLRTGLSVNLQLRNVSRTDECNSENKEFGRKFMTLRLIFL